MVVDSHIVIVVARGPGGGGLLGYCKNDPLGFECLDI